jgi:hypothetical protein
LSYSAPNNWLTVRAYLIDLRLRLPMFEAAGFGVFFQA